MRTNKCISTISYNSPEFLKRMLDDLYERNLISFWCFIKHTGEMLDNGKEQIKEKDHIHLFIEPNTQIDTMQLQKQSEEYDPNNPLHPLKCIYFRHSEWCHWLWYDLHDPDYLAMKMEERQFQYDLSEFEFSDIDEFNERSTQALHDSEIFKDMKLKRILKTHTVSELVYMGMIKPHLANQYYYFEKLYRTGEAKSKDRVKGEHERLKQLAEEIALGVPSIHSDYIGDAMFNDNYDY